MQTPILKSEHSDDNNISKLDIKPQPINSEEEREKVKTFWVNLLIINSLLENWSEKRRAARKNRAT